MVMSKSKPSLKIAIAGLGVVGAEVARQVINRSDQLCLVAGVKMQVVAVSARNRSMDRGINFNNIDWHDDATKLAECDDVNDWWKRRCCP